MSLEVVSIRKVKPVLSPDFGPTSGQDVDGFVPTLPEPTKVVPEVVKVGETYFLAGEEDHTAWVLAALINMDEIAVRVIGRQEVQGRMPGWKNMLSRSEETFEAWQMAIYMMQHSAENPT